MSAHARARMFSHCLQRVFRPRENEAPLKQPKGTLRYPDSTRQTGAITFLSLQFEFEAYLNPFCIWSPRILACSLNPEPQILPGPRCPTESRYSLPQLINIP